MIPWSCYAQYVGLVDHAGDVCDLAIVGGGGVGGGGREVRNMRHHPGPCTAAVTTLIVLLRHQLSVGVVGAVAALVAGAVRSV